MGNNINGTTQENKTACNTAAVMSIFSLPLSQHQNGEFVEVTKALSHKWITTQVRKKIIWIFLELLVIPTFSNEQLLDKN